MKKLFLFLLIAVACHCTLFANIPAPIDTTAQEPPTQPAAGANAEQPGQVNAPPANQPQPGGVAGNQNAGPQPVKVPPKPADPATQQNVGNEPQACACVPKPNENKPDATWWLLVFMPVVLFVVLGVVLLKSIKGFSFSEALSENELPRYTITNPEYNSLQALVTAAAAAPDKINLGEMVPPTIDVNLLPPAYNAPASPVDGAATTILPQNNFRASISRYIAFFSGILTIIVAVCTASFFIYYYMHTGCPPDLSTLSTVLIALGIGVAPYAVNKVSGALAARKTDD